MSMYKRLVKKWDTDEGQFLYRCDKCASLFQTKSLAVIHIWAADHHADDTNSAGWTAIPNPKAVKKDKLPDVVDLTEKDDDNNDVHQQSEIHKLQEAKKNNDKLQEAKKNNDKLQGLKKNNDKLQGVKKNNDKLQGVKNNNDKLQGVKKKNDKVQIVKHDKPQEVKNDELQEVNRDENPAEKVMNCKLSDDSEVAESEGPIPAKKFANSLFVPVKMNTEFGFEFEDVNILEEGQSQPEILQNSDSCESMAQSNGDNSTSIVRHSDKPHREEPAVKLGEILGRFSSVAAVVIPMKKLRTNINKPDNKQLPSRYICENCGKGFTISFIFEGHIKTCGVEISKQAEVNIPPEFFKACPICGKAFHSHSTWSMHRSSCVFTPKDWNTTCPIPTCRKTCSTLLFLRSHMETVHSHAAGDQIQCAICEKKFNLRKAFYVHLGRKHGENKKTGKRNTDE